MKSVKVFLNTSLLLLITTATLAQGYWQQKADYKMDILFDTDNHQFSGDQVITYTNNSPDTLNQIFYHLYYNAFQPGSMMEWHRRLTPNPDPRFPLMDEIGNLKDTETGWHKVKTLTQDGEELEYEISYTTLEVKLAKPILPGQSTTFKMQFESQVPLQIRRTGRDSFDGVDYSMAQWFPKLAEYDPYGWHTHPYVGREFYAPWGDYEVNITIDKKYVLAGTGIVQNPNEVGYGYEDEGVKVKRKGKTLTWKFKANNVHDFVWAADTDYEQTTAQVPNGPLLRFFYIKGEETELWRTELPTYTVKCFEYMNENFGKYGWSQYSVIQGGDGGMEYPMATLIINKKRSTGVRSLNSIVGTMVHEVMHSWYQGMLATNESYYSWMDEGFATYAEDYVVNEIQNLGEDNPTRATINYYIRWANTGKEEAAVLHDDHFITNRGYSFGSYYKGAVALAQLNYIIGEEVLHKGMIKYRNQWGFKHPHPNDFIRLMEKESNIQLRWFFDDWINTTYTIDYQIQSVADIDNTTKVTLGKVGRIPMPLDITITKTDGSQFLIYIPIGVMRGEKVNDSGLERTTLSDWFWTHPEYAFTLDFPSSEIKSIEIDASGRMADVDRSNNFFPFQN
ncbi:MAG: M1 family metallopeptidase [Cyclobacteriaceae bacterium]